MNCPRCNSCNIEYDKAMSRSAGKHIYRCQNCAKWIVMTTAPAPEPPKVLAAPGQVTPVKLPRNTPMPTKRKPGPKPGTPKPKVPKPKKVVAPSEEGYKPEFERYVLTFLVCPSCGSEMGLALGFWRCKCGNAIEDGLFEVPGKSKLEQV